MNLKLKWLFPVLLALVLVTQEKVCKHPISVRFGHKYNQGTSLQDTSSDGLTNSMMPSISRKDTIYEWNEYKNDWVAVGLLNQQHDFPALNHQIVQARFPQETIPIKVDWEMLTKIQYHRKYFESMKMDLFAPVFPPNLKDLDGKMISIEGFVIPIDRSGDILALSANPYASCFFCGKASPASVLTLQLKKSGKRYKMDAFLSFSGKLRLNYDDPGQFYYILEEATEILE